MDDKLLPYQKEHVLNIYNSIKKYSRALDASDTGTGKTYTSIALCVKLKLRPFIICPKSVISSWINILSNFNFSKNEYDLTTYEQIINHKFIKKNKNNSKNDKEDIKKNLEDDEEDEDDENDEDDDVDLDLDDDDNNLFENKKYYLEEKKKILKKEENYEWLINNPKLYLFIYDEAHKCKNRNTINGKILIKLSDLDTNILLLSATAVDKPLNFLIFGYTLKLYKTFEEGLTWLSSVFNKKAKHPLIAVHNLIFPEYASRMCIDEIKNIFKDNTVEMEGIKMDNYYEIECQYDLMNEKITKKNNLSNIQKIRQQIEILKVDTFVKMTNQYLEMDKSVVIFVNFTETLLLLSKKLKTKCVVYGQQTITERSQNINNFCADFSRIIICNIQSGGCGISLHDTHNKYPRVSLISPTWSAQDLMQVLGRIHRATGKSDCIQRIIFCKDTFEENIGKMLKDKINNIRMLNDGDKILKKDNMKNIIEKEFKLQKKKKEKETIIYRTNDFDKIQDVLSNLYDQKDILENDINNLKLENNLNRKIKELEYNLEKINKEIKFNEDNLNLCINLMMENI